MGLEGSRATERRDHGGGTLLQTHQNYHIDSALSGHGRVTQMWLQIQLQILIGIWTFNRSMSHTKQATCASTTKGSQLPPMLIHAMPQRTGSMESLLVKGSRHAMTCTATLPHQLRVLPENRPWDSINWDEIYDNYLLQRMIFPVLICPPENVTKTWTFDKLTNTHQPDPVFVLTIKLE